MGAIFGFLAKGGAILTGITSLIGGGLAVENYMNGSNSFARRFMKSTFEGIAESQADAAQEAAWYSLAKIAEMLARFVDSVGGKGGKFSNMLHGWADRSMNDFGAQDKDTSMTFTQAIGLDDPNAIPAPERTAMEHVGHTAHVALDATLDVGINVVSLAPQAIDLVDDAWGSAVQAITGYDTGYAKRDLSEAFKHSVDAGIRTVIPRSELQGAWDHIVDKGIKFGSYFIPYAGIAMAVGDVKQGAENYTQTGSVTRSIYDPAIPQ